MRQGQSLRSIHRTDDPVNMFVHQRPPAPGPRLSWWHTAARLERPKRQPESVVTRPGSPLPRCRAPRRPRGRRYATGQPPPLQERELPVARQVHPITTLSAPKYPHQVPNRSKMRIIAATGPGAFFRCARPGRGRGRRRPLDSPRGTERWTGAARPSAGPLRPFAGDLEPLGSDVQAEGIPPFARCVSRWSSRRRSAHTARLLSTPHTAPAPPFSFGWSGPVRLRFIALSHAPAERGQVGPRRARTPARPPGRRGTRLPRPGRRHAPPVRGR